MTSRLHQPTLSRGGYVTLAVLLLLVAGGQKHNPHPVKRVGMVTGIKEEMLEPYRRLHADSHSGVRHLLQKYHLHNFNIFVQGSFKIVPISY
ncbi:MAG: L-rhamnose mutarotase, partial [Planctomycetota bacterium]